MHTYTGHKETPHSLSISDDNTLVMSASSDAIHVWESATGKRRLTLPGPWRSDFVGGFGPDAQTIAVSVKDGVDLKDITTGKSLFTFPNTLWGAPTISQDGRWLLVFVDLGVLAIWDVVKRKLIRQVDSSAFSFLFSPDNKFVAAHSHEEFVVRSFPDWKTYQTLPNSRWFLGAQTSMAFSPSGTMLAMNMGNGTTQIWQLASGAEYQILKDPYLYPKFRDDGVGLGFLPDIKTIFTAGRNGVIKFWSVDRGYLHRELKVHQKTIRAAQISKDGRYLITASEDRQIKVWQCQKHPCAEAECVSTSDCGVGQICDQCKCTQCKSSEQCDATKSCIEGVCSVGECRDVEGCDSGQVCKDGKCGVCVNDAECGPMRICEKNECTAVHCQTYTDCEEGKACVKGRCQPCAIDDDCGDNALCHQLQCCPQLKNDKQALQRCIPGVHVCDRMHTAKACYEDTDCEGNTICWWGHCVNRAQWEKGTDFDCLESVIAFGYGGAASDRVYTFELTLPSIETQAGAKLPVDETFFLYNPWWIFAERGSLAPINYYAPVVFSHSATHMSFKGSSDFRLFRMKPKDPSTSIGLGWLGTNPVPLEWDIKWPFSADDPGRFRSYLLIKIWHDDGECKSTITYEADLAATSISMTMPPKVRKLCQWPL